MSWTKDAAYQDHIKAILYIWQGGMAVSYTHLDVYKRQGIHHLYENGEFIFHGSGNDETASTGKRGFHGESSC